MTAAPFFGPPSGWCSARYGSQWMHVRHDAGRWFDKRGVELRGARRVGPLAEERGGMSFIDRTSITRAEQAREAALQYVETDLGGVMDCLTRAYDDLYGDVVGQSWTIPYGMSAAEMEEVQQRLEIAAATLKRLRDGFNPIRESV